MCQLLPAPKSQPEPSGGAMAAFRSAFDAGEMRTEFEKAGIKPTFIPFIWKHLLHDPNNLSSQNLASEFEWEQAVPSLPSAAYCLLRSKFKPLTSSVHSVVDSSDQVTTKLLIKLQVPFSSFIPSPFLLGKVRFVP